VGIIGTGGLFVSRARPQQGSGLEGIAKAKATGVYKGRKPSLDVGEIRKLWDEGLGPTGIAKRLKIGRASVYVSSQRVLVRRDPPSWRPARAGVGQRCATEAGSSAIGCHYCHPDPVRTALPLCPDMIFGRDNGGFCPSTRRTTTRSARTWRWAKMRRWGGEFSDPVSLLPSRFLSGLHHHYVRI